MARALTLTAFAAFVLAVTAATAALSAATPSGAALPMWSTQYSALSPSVLEHEVVLYQQLASKKILLVQGNAPGVGGTVCGIEPASGKLLWCEADGTPNDAPIPVRGPLGTDNGDDGLAAFMTRSGAPVLTVLDAYSGKRKWNNSAQFTTASSGFPRPAIQGDFVFAGTTLLHAFQAFDGTPVATLKPATEAAAKLSGRPAALTTGGRQLLIAPWFCAVVAYDYTNATATDAQTTIAPRWSAGTYNGSSSGASQCVTSGVPTSDGEAVVLISSASPEFFVIVDALSGKQQGPYTPLPVGAQILAADRGLVFTSRQSDGPKVFRAAADPAPVWAASTNPALSALEAFECATNAGPASKKAVTVIVCSATSFMTQGSVLLGFDALTGELLFNDALPLDVRARGHPAVDGAGDAFFTIIVPTPNASAATQTAYVTRFAIVAPSKRAITIAEYAGAGCTGTARQTALSQGCTATAAGASVKRLCVNGAMYVEEFAKSASCSGAPTRSTTVPTGQCVSSELSGSSFKVTSCP